MHGPHRGLCRAAKFNASFLYSQAESDVKIDLMSEAERCMLLSVHTSFVAVVSMNLLLGHGGDEALPGGSQRTWS